jgi:hypothetical protein
MKMYPTEYRYIDPKTRIRYQIRANVSYDDNNIYFWAIVYFKSNKPHYPTEYDLREYHDTLEQAVATVQKLIELHHLELQIETMEVQDDDFCPDADDVLFI